MTKNEDRKTTLTGYSDSRLGDHLHHQGTSGMNKSEVPSDAVSMITGGTGGNTKIEK